MKSCIDDCSTLINDPSISGFVNQSTRALLQDVLDEAPWPLHVDASMSLNVASFESSMSFDFEIPSTDQHELIGTSWIALDGKLVKPITIEFDTGNHVIGTTGCNRYGGAVELSDSTITFGARFQTTRLYCHGVMDQERNYLSFLKSTSFFYDIIKTGDKDELILYSSAPESQEGAAAIRGEILARFVKDNMM